MSEADKDLQIKTLQIELEKANQRLSDLYTKYGVCVGEKDTAQLSLNLKNKETNFYHNFSFHLYEILKHFSPDDTDISLEDLFFGEIRSYIKDMKKKNNNPITICDLDLFSKIEKMLIKSYNIETFNDYDYNYNSDFM